MLDKEKLLKIFEKYKNESTGGIYMTKWDSMADDIMSSQNSSKPHVGRSKCDFHAAFTFCGDNGITYCSNCGDPV